MHEVELPANLMGFRTTIESGQDVDIKTIEDTILPLVIKYTLQLKDSALSRPRYGLEEYCL